MSVTSARRTVIDLLPVALRDTALTISDIGQTNALDEEWARSLLIASANQVAQLKTELRARGMPPDQIEDAVYAQCALLDEAALSKLEGDARSEWERKPLQITELEVNNAGEELVRRIEQRLREAPPVRPLLAIFAAVLDLGFTGRLALDGYDARHKLRRALDDRLDVTQDTRAESDSVVVAAPVTRTWTQRISPPGCVALACVAIGVLWFAINGWLDASVRAMH